MMAISVLRHKKKGLYPSSDGMLLGKNIFMATPEVIPLNLQDEHALYFIYKQTLLHTGSIANLLFNAVSEVKTA